jgi:hypothetical protein
MLEVGVFTAHGRPSGFDEYVEGIPGLSAHPEAWAELAVLVHGENLFRDKRLVGLMHYRRIFSLDESLEVIEKGGIDVRERFKVAEHEISFLHHYQNQIVIPIAEDLGITLWENFEEWHSPLVRALVIACDEFDKQLIDRIGVVDSQNHLRSTQQIYPYNMWIGSREFYFEWLELLRPVLAKLDSIRSELPDDGYQSRWAGFIAERLFTVYVDSCRVVNRWSFTERPVIFFEDKVQTTLDNTRFELKAALDFSSKIFIERDIAIEQRDIAIEQRDIAIEQRDIAIEQLFEIRSSKAWSITKPFRKLVSFIKNII